MKPQRYLQALNKLLSKRWRTAGQDMNGAARDDDEASTRKEFLNAVRRGDLERVRHLVLDYHVDVNVRFDDAVDPTAIYAACRLKDGGEMVRFMVENGANVDPGGDHHVSPLDKAVRYCRLETVEVLIGHGANLNPFKGVKPVENACTYGNLKLLRTLISHGGKFDVFKATGRLCCRKELPEAECSAMFQVLADQVDGFKDKVDKDGWKPVHYASSSRHSGLVRLLIAQDQRLILAQGNNGNNPLHLTENIEVAKALLENPYNDVTEKLERDPSVVREMLLSRNYFGQTPLDTMLYETRIPSISRKAEETLKEKIEYVRTYFSSLVADVDSGAINPDFNPFQRRLATDIRNDLERVLVGDLVVQIMSYLTPVDVMNRSIMEPEEAKNTSTI